MDLVRSGFYDDLNFHRIIPNFVIQGGCPQGTGTGGPGWNVKAEFNDRPHVEGTLSMARRADPDSAGSQFFICLSREGTARLDVAGLAPFTQPDEERNGEDGVIGQRRR